ncbi:NAD(P)H-dependent oxidoreductase subunit E [Maricaulis sp.]|uniref:NADH-quinone oxidoreductase subunit NuoE family protein n=1 Tax=Maricaulis sp. TaxID=1486257 RepID=UPI003A8CB6EB
MSQTDSGTSDRETVERICAAHDHRADALIEILHDIQTAQHCISDAAARIVATSLNLSRAEIQGVRSFYADFSTAPRDPHRVRLCRAEACQSLGADRLAAELDAAGIAHDAVYCLGNCALGPAALAGDQLIGRATAGRIATVCAGVHRDD